MRQIILFLILFISLISSCNSSNPKKNKEDSTSNALKADTTKPYPFQKLNYCRFKTVPVYKFNTDGAVYFETGMKIDADGSPHAYNPKNTGLDDIKNAGKPGNWWGIATKDNNTDGELVIQTVTDPAPGYYVSTTSLIDKAVDFRNPKRYVDAETIPYFVLPTEVTNSSDIDIGDIALIYNRKKLGFSCLCHLCRYWSGR